MSDEKPPTGDSKDTGKPGSDDAGEQKNLSQILNEWEDEGSTDDKAALEKAASRDARLEALELREAKRSYDNGMDTLATILKGDMDVDDIIVKGWAENKASDNPKLIKLWENREQNKAAFDDAISALKPEFQKYVKTNVHAAVKDAKKDDDKGLVSAVKGAREITGASSGFEEKDVAGMGDNEFALYKAEVFRLAEAGKLK